MAQLASQNPDRPTPVKWDAALVRSSCDSCGESKTRCSREKPACRRCVRKDITCFYSAPKRPGRPTTKRQRSTTDAVPGSSRSHNSPTASPRAITPTVETNNDPTGHNYTPPTANGNSSPTISPPANPQPTTPGDDLWMSMLSSPEFNALFGTSEFDDFSYDMSLANMDLDGFNPVSDTAIGPATNTPFLASKATDGLGNAPSSDLTSLGVGNILPVTHGQIPSMAALSSLFEPGDRADNAMIGSKESMADDSSSFCCCHSRALKLLAEPSPPDGPSTGTDHSLDTVLDRNAAATTTVVDILQCRCKKDTYMLVHISLALYKALQWYEATVSADGSPQDSTPRTFIAGKNSGHDAASRKAIQLVLSQLPGFQQATCALSDHSEAAKRSSGTDNRSTLSTLLETLIRDLRSYTRGLARKAIVRLR